MALFPKLRKNLENFANNTLGKFTGSDVNVRSGVNNFQAVQSGTASETQQQQFIAQAETFGQTIPNTPIRDIVTDVFPNVPKWAWIAGGAFLLVVIIK